MGRAAHAARRRISSETRRHLRGRCSRDGVTRRQPSRQRRQHGGHHHESAAQRQYCAPDRDRASFREAPATGVLPSAPVPVACTGRSVLKKTRYSDMACR
jgi:hypothetical protein